VGGRGGVYTPRIIENFSLLSAKRGKVFLILHHLSKNLHTFPYPPSLFGSRATTCGHCLREFNELREKMETIIEAHEITSRRLD